MFHRMVYRTPRPDFDQHYGSARLVRCGQFWFESSGVTRISNMTTTVAAIDR
jgi:hypothetical protein